MPHSAVSVSSTRESEFPDEGKRYQVRLADADDMPGIFKLRYDIFYGEMGANDTASLVAGADVDRYDELCDHLVVYYGSELVGTYRLLPWERVAQMGLSSYSENEFTMAPIMEVYGTNVLELGRSCVHPAHRNGSVPRLLWAGIASYLLERNVDALVGCVSLHDISDIQALRLRDALVAKDLWDTRFQISAKNEYLISDNILSEIDDHVVMMPQDPLRLIPPLMKGYFNLGTKVCGGPARDLEFHCHDFLMLLDMKNISLKYYNALVKNTSKLMSKQEVLSFSR